MAPLVFIEVRRVCNELRENLPNIHCLPAKYETSSHAIRNSRRKMEDRHVVIPDLNDHLGAQVKICIQYALGINGNDRQRATLAIIVVCIPLSDDTD